jgi:glycosyltransferase involved in cell wall biosynthesis
MTGPARGTRAGEPGAARPRFSIVSAVYDVEPYLDDFIGSIEAQRAAPGDLEVIVVDDGSTDGSLARLERWARESPLRITVRSQANAGAGAARNRGLREATGEWVTFADPDDRLGDGYLAAVARFADAHPGIDLIAARPILHLEAENRYARHPRWKQYRRGTRVADLTTEPNVFPGSPTVSFYRLERLRSAGIEFDVRIRPNFEDGHVAARYLLTLDPPAVGLVREAEYRYRKRADQSSALQRSLTDPRRYTTVLELGYLDVIRRARERRGAVPEWLQQVLVYELYWYLAEDEKLASGAIVDAATVARFHELLAEILDALEPEVVGRHAVHKLGSAMADVLAHAGRRPRQWHSPGVVRTAIDRAMQLQRISYRFRGDRPSETFVAGGAELEPAFEKTISVRYYDRTMLSERSVWLPLAGPLDVRLDGAVVPVRRRWPRPGWRPEFGPGPIGGRAGPRASRSRAFGSRSRWRRRARRAARLPLRFARLVAWPLRRRGARPAQRLTGRFLRWLAGQSPWLARFRGAWLFQDRVHDADDNGERLFDHVRRERPDINAWFVLERGTPDWARLERAYPGRLLAHGSLAWKMAMLNCTWLLSSHVDVPVYRPAALAHTGRATWRFGFLQHGVTKDDLSVWLNRRELELFVVSTPAELESVAGDGTAYKFTHKETRLTGLPRFDRMLRLGRAVPEPERDLVIVAPTWRQWLAQPLGVGSQRRQLEQAFWESDYVTSWLGLLRSEEVAAALRRRGWRLGFMPHPNLQGMLPLLDLPGHVEPLSFAGTDVQAVYARCALLVTDYSSVAFNTAYIDRPLVYFQFDRDRMLGGGHVGRHGYFDYQRDGFGPVVEDLDAAIRAMVEAIERGPTPAPLYQARIDATFGERDGRCCERVVAAVEALSRPYPGHPASPQDGDVADVEGPR